MLGAIKRIILTNKQNLINKRFPNLNIVLHPDMPSPSMNKMVEVGHLVNQVNALEARVSLLSDKELAEKTEEFKKHLKIKSDEIAIELGQDRKSVV